jgi:hypothetical protein
MLKKCLIFCLVLFLAHTSNAQETTYGDKEESLIKRSNALGSLVIIPFENRMYLSDADGPIGKETGLNPGELQVKFRNSLISTLEEEMQKDWDLQRLYEPTSMDRNGSLEFIHGAVKYRFVEVSNDVLLENDTTLDPKKLKKESKKKKEKEGIVNGQIVSRSNSRPQFMNMEVNNDTLLNFLERTLNADYYLFINEFDIRYFVADPDRVASGGLFYNLKIHFTCIDRKGKTMVAGISTSNVQANTQNIYEIISQSIPILTKKTAKMIRKFKTKEKP